MKRNCPEGPPDKVGTSGAVPSAVEIQGLDGICLAGNLRLCNTSVEAGATIVVVIASIAFQMVPPGTAVDSIITILA